MRRLSGTPTNARCRNLNLFQDHDKYRNPWSNAMSSRKRPYPHDERESLRGTPFLNKKGRLAIISDAGTSAASSCTTSSIERHIDHHFHGDELMEIDPPSPVACISSASSGDLLEVPSSTETPWTPFTASSNAEAAEVRSRDDEVEVCFGMLVNGLLSPCKSSQIPTNPFTKVGASNLKPRFRAKGITLLNSASQEIGVLDNDTASGMTVLKNSVSSVRFDIYLCLMMKQIQSQDGKLGIPLEILVFGPKHSLGQVGSLLSQLSLFLQEPINRQLSVPYKNPHVFTWDEEEDGTNSSYLLEPSPKSQIELTDKIQAVLNNTSAPQFYFQIQQDTRITSTLKQHQLIALKFMISREGLVNTSRLTLWRPVIKNGRQAFENEITHSTKFSEPAESRGGILADEMGMGKSLSLLALIIYTLSCQKSNKEENGYLPSEKKDVRSTATLIIAPKSTIHGWVQQIKEHTQPGALKFHVFHGDKGRISLDDLCKFDIVLTTYETAASNAFTTDTLSRISWLRIVLDEAHQIRNRSTRTFQEITKLRAERRWCLTGTPVQNKLSDLFSLTQFLRFEPLDNHANARKFILGPLRGNDPEQGLNNLRLALKTMSLRRTKDSCNIRQKTEAIEQVILTGRERDFYTTIRAEAKKALSSATGKSQGQIILRAINTFRQICSHGGETVDIAQDIQHARDHQYCDKCGELTDTQNGSQQTFSSSCGHNVCYECRLDQNGSDTTSLNNGPEFCAVCQEPVISTLDDGQQWSDGRVNNEPVDWGANTSQGSAILSSKIEKVVMNLQNLEQASPPCKRDPIKSLVFSHWNRTLDCLGDALSYHGQLYVRIDGTLSIEQRRTVIHQFNTVPEIRILLLSYGTGSVGLNLQAASHVHLLEPHWNPMVEAQAAARVDRLDQLKHVHIYRYIVKDSIEEQIQNTQRGKLQDVELSMSRMATGEYRNIGAENPMGLRDLL